MKEHRFEMGTLPPNPPGFFGFPPGSLGRKSEITRSRGIPAAESAPGFRPGSQYPPFRWPHFSKNDLC